MINFTSLNSICNDILHLVRNYNIAQSENISIRQIESWVHQYRSLLIKQDLDKGKYPNPDYIQEIPYLKLIKSDASEGRAVSYNGKYLYRTELQIPKGIDLNYMSGIMFVGSLDGKEISLIPRSRASYQKYKKYTGRDTISWLKNQYLYIQSDEALSAISIRIIAEIPTEIDNMINSMTVPKEYKTSDKYPIPINMLGTLKDMIFRNEFNFSINQFTDESNDNSNTMTTVKSNEQ